MSQLRPPGPQLRPEAPRPFEAWTGHMLMGMDTGHGHMLIEMDTGYGNGQWLWTLYGHCINCIILYL